MEFGCAELRFFSYFKNLKGITSVLEVDIDRAILERFKDQVVPLFYHYVIERSEPLGVVVSFLYIILGLLFPIVLINLNQYVGVGGERSRAGLSAHRMRCSSLHRINRTSGSRCS